MMPLDDDEASKAGCIINKHIKFMRNYTKHMLMALLLLGGVATGAAKGYVWGKTGESCMYISDEMNMQFDKLSGQSNDMVLRWCHFSTTNTDIEIPAYLPSPDDAMVVYPIVEIDRNAFTDGITSGKKHEDIYKTDYPTDAYYVICELTSISLPETIVRIGDMAFAGAHSLKEITFPSSATEIGEECLYWSGGLEQVVLPASIKTVPNGFVAMSRNLKECELPASVEKIGTRAFFRCNSMTKIHIPAGVREIGDDAYTALVSLENFEVDPANEWYCAPDGILLDKEMKTLIAWPFARKDVKVPEGVERIAGEALNWGFELTSLDLPESLTDISNTTFRYDTSLKSVTVKSTQPPACAETSEDCMFAEEVYANAELWVPQESVDEYRAHSVWGKFNCINGVSVGVDKLSAAEEEAVYYSLDGQKVDNPERGQILIRRIGGAAEKVRY